MIDRPVYLETLSTALRRSPITAVLGPRQCGKTTLVRMFGTDKPVTYFDLESQPDLQRLQNPEMVLGSLKDISNFVIDMTVSEQFFSPASR